MLSESKYLADFLVGFLGKKPQTLLIPMYSTTVLYDTYLENDQYLADADTLAFFTLKTYYHCCL